MFKQVSEIDTRELRSFCIANRFYTHGDCKAYENMFELARKYCGGVEILEMVAEDIYDHSGYDELENFNCFSCDSRSDTISLLMTEIYRKCVTVYFV